MQNLTREKTKKLIGLVLDTNQFTSPKIQTKEEASHWFNKLITTYGEDVISSMKLATWENTHKTFSTFMTTGLTLSEYLQGDEILY